MSRCVPEVTGVILRFRNDPNALVTDPFDYVMYGKGDLGVVHLCGFNNTPKPFLDPVMRRELAERLIELGFHTAFWTRMKNGQPHRFYIDLAALMKKSS